MSVRACARVCGVCVCLRLCVAFKRLHVIMFNLLIVVVRNRKRIILGFVPEIVDLQ